ncbi:hypothetical protein ABIB94_009133 [Bradyrhizobium sp. JR7.2]
MRPTTADDNVFNFDALLHPGTVFEAPRDVLDHPALTLSEKRAILASWASDASAIASCPSMRAPAGLKKPVSIDEILDALRALDGGPPDATRRKALPSPFDRTCSCGGVVSEAQMMMDDNLARLRAHHNNISRYRRLLRTKLLPLERQFIERRLSEEEAALQSLSVSTFPIAFNEPRPGRPLAVAEVMP